MLQIGNGEFANDMDANRAHIGMWAMLAAPLFAGTSIPNLKPEILDAMVNPDLVAIDQDPLGKQAKQLSNDAGAQVWARPLTDNKMAVALYNSSGNAKTISTTLAAVGGTGTYTVRSVWDKQNVMNTSGTLSALVPARGSVIYVLTPGQDPSLPAIPELQGSATIPAGSTQDVTFSVTNTGDAAMEDVAVTFGTATGVTLPIDAQSVGTIAGKSSKDFTVSITTAENAQGSIQVPTTITYGGESITTSVVVSVPLRDKAYVSDLRWISSSNGWGPVERDQAVGDDKANDGPKITLGGVTYDKGIGTNPEAKLSFAVDGQCTALKATIGIDDDVIPRAAKDKVTPRSTFEVFVDGESKYNSTFTMGTDAPTAIDVDITGGNVIEMRNNLVGTAASASWHAWADWADAHLVCGATEPTPEPTETQTSTPTVTITSTATATATASTTATATATTTATATATPSVCAAGSPASPGPTPRSRARSWCMTAHSARLMSPGAAA